jgi:hypothetical protein
MTKWRQIALAILIAGAALLCLQVAHRRQSLSAPASADAVNSALDGSETGPTHGPITSALPLTVAEPVLSGPTAPSQHINPPPPSPSAPVADTPESTTLPPATILENMRTTIHQYGSAFRENPVGTNPEITAALQGDNPKHINFLKQDGNRVNAIGELVDAWGTPYFFHQISGHEMEIRSAGPDRVMYTGDDLVAK